MKSSKVILCLILSLFLLFTSTPVYAAIIGGSDYAFAFRMASSVHDKIGYNYTAPSGTYIMSVSAEWIYRGQPIPDVDVYIDGVLRYSEEDCGNFNISNLMASNIRISYSTSSGGGQDWQGTMRLGYDIADNPTVEQVRDAANNAKLSADTAASNAQSALNAVSNGNGNTVTAVRDANGTVLSEARQAKNNSQNAYTYALNAYNTAQTVNTKIDTLSTAVTNIQNSMGSDTSPPVVEITTVSGALATSGGSIKAVINASDNISTLFEYSLYGTAYHPLPTDGAVELPVINPGTNLITVWVKDEAGNVGRDSITIRKLG